MMTNQQRAYAGQAGKKIAADVRTAIGNPLRALRQLNELLHATNMADKAFQELNNLGNSMDLADAEAAKAHLQSVQKMVAKLQDDAAFTSVLANVGAACAVALEATGRMIENVPTIGTPAPEPQPDVAAAAAEPVPPPSEG